LQELVQGLVIAGEGEQLFELVDDQQ